MKDYRLARTAFEAYVRQMNGHTHDGKPIPGWEALSQEVQDGWYAVAEAAVTAAIMESCQHGFEPTHLPSTRGGQDE